MIIAKIVYSKNAAIGLAGNRTVASEVTTRTSEVTAVDKHLLRPLDGERREGIM